MEDSMTENLLDKLRNLKEDDGETPFIKKGWLDDITNNDIFTDNDNKYQISITDCINNCTSPRKSKLAKPISEEDLKLIFNAFSLFPLKDTKVLIIGQDPYPETDKAQGLSFSVKNGYTEKNGIDDSLLNIYKAIKASNEKIMFDELSSEQIKEIKGNEKNGKWINFWKTDLTNWAKNNGVLLLNSALTYKKYDFDEHILSDEDKKFINDEGIDKFKEKEQNKIQTIHINAWKPFIYEIIKKLINPKNNNKLVVFLWGRPAQATYYNAIRTIEEEIDYDEIKIMRKMIFMTSHPSKRSFYKGFKQDTPNHFKACDEFLLDDKGNKLKIWLNFPNNNKPEN